MQARAIKPKIDRTVINTVLEDPSLPKQSNYASPEPHDPEPHDPEPHDIVIIGGGVVGCAVFREFVLAGARCALVERDDDLLNGASKGNSGLLHTGFDAPPNSVELACIRDGYRKYADLCEDLGLSLERTSAIMVAWTKEERDRLPGIVCQAHSGGVLDVVPLSADDVRNREPDLNPAVLGGILVPGEAVIDPWSAPLAYALQGLANGGKIQRGTEVLGGSLDREIWRLETTAGEIRARVVVNCAGNYGDLVESIARPSPFEIRPRVGQFVVYDKPAHDLVSAIIVPVPNEHTKGIIACRTAFGNLLVGPTAENQDDRCNATVDEAVLRRIINRGEFLIPKLRDYTINATYAGIRPATQFKDYQIEALKERRWITVAGIRSTGLSASLGISDLVRGLYEEHFATLTPLEHIRTVTVPNLTEHRPRPFMREGRSEIVCHCERVTAREIEDALSGPLPARTLGGLRRRTRCMLGHCQGFYCTPRIIEMAKGRVSELERVPATCERHA